MRNRRARERALERLSRPFGRGRSSSTQSFAVAADTLFAAMTTPPTQQRKVLINNLITALQISGVWAKLDAFYVLAAQDAQAASLNWKNPATFTLTENGLVTFTANQGYAGDGSTGFLDSGFNPSTAGGNYAQDSAHLSVRNRTSRAADATSQIGLRNNAQNSFADLACRFSGDLMVARPNSGAAGGTFAVTDSVGHFLANRSASNAVQPYRNASSLGSGTAASAALISGNIYILAENRVGVGVTVPSTDQIASVSIGGSLSAVEVTAFYNAELAYMQGVGAV